MSNTLFFNTVIIVLIGLYILDMFNITETFKDQIGTYNLCSNCNEPSKLCGCQDKDGSVNGDYVTRKYPNYYGLGTWGYHYGEPYYQSKIELPPKTCNVAENK